jgi:lipopolysaccharide export system permease protein
MSTSQINRYIIREVLSPTLLGIIIFTLVMVMGRAFSLVDLVINKGVSPADILVLLATLLPTCLSISLPLAFLMGIMVGFGRLSADSETVAFKSAGIGLARMSIPVFLLAAIFAFLSGATNLWGQPWGFKAFATKSFEIARNKATIGLKPRVFMNHFSNLVVYANELDNRSDQLQGLFIVEKKAGATAWIFADSGNIITNAESQTVTIRLHDGVIHRREGDSDDQFQLIHFRNYDVQPELTTISDASSRSLKPKELPTGKLWSSIGKESDPSKNQKLRAELHERLISPLAPLLFVLFGLPFSMQSQRAGRSGGFVMGLLIFICYYFITSTAYSLTKDAAVPPWLTFWLPQLVLAITGILFLRQSSLEQPNRLLGRLDQALYTLQKWTRKRDDS